MKHTGKLYSKMIKRSNPNLGTYVIKTYIYLLHNIYVHICISQFVILLCFLTMNVPFNTWNSANAHYDCPILMNVTDIKVVCPPAIHS